MEKIKIIDLFNKIANGEETPRKFIFNGDEFYLQGKYYYRCDEKHQIFEESFILENLNNEIELIEEDNKIEKLTMSRFTRNQKAIAKKVNEIIDYLNKENK